jgi:hypothetical protein
VGPDERFPSILIAAQARGDKSAALKSTATVCRAAARLFLRRIGV